MFFRFVVCSRETFPWGTGIYGIPAIKSRIYFFHLSNEVPDADPLNSLTDN